LVGNWVTTGPAADALVQAILDAPEGHGPPWNGPERCTAMHPWRLLVLTVHGSHHDQDVALRTGPCDRSGTDDGTTLRQLTDQLRDLLPPQALIN
jgi:hypothetical protein